MSDFRSRFVKPKRTNELMFRAEFEGRSPRRVMKQIRMWHCPVIGAVLDCGKVRVDIQFGSKQDFLELVTYQPFV
jgi:hypothetical protein